MTLTSLLDKIRDTRLENFVAPIVDADEVYVWTMQNGIPYRMHVAGSRPGWWMLSPDTESKAHIQKPAHIFMQVDYLKMLPPFNVIVLARLSEHAALCTPYNASDAAQRGWLNGQPRLLHLPRLNFEPFDVVVARSMAGVLLYDEINTRLGWNGLNRSLLRESVYQNKTIPGILWSTPELRSAARIVIERLQEAEREQELARIQGQQATTEERLRWQLDFMGAGLNEWSELPNGYRVVWSYNGHEYNMQIRKDLRVESAGICLSGTDSQHNLSAIVAVMQEAHRRNRPDL